MCKIYVGLYWLFTSFSSSVGGKTLSISTLTAPVTVSLAFGGVNAVSNLKDILHLISGFKMSSRLPAWLSPCCMATGRKQNSVHCLGQILLSQKFYFEIPALSPVGDGAKGDYDIESKIQSQNFYICAPFFVFVS